MLVLALDASGSLMGLSLAEIVEENLKGWLD